MTLFQYYFLQFTAINIMLGWALYLPFRANQLYFGAIYSMCIGGYFAAYTSVNLGWPLWLILPVAVFVCVLFSLVPALKLADLGGFTMLIATMALLIIIQTVTRNLEVLGGLHGIFGLPVPSRPVMLIYTFILLLLTGFFVYRIDHSHIGRSMDAARLDKHAAGTLGINVKKLSVQLQLMSSAIGAVAGALYAFSLGGIFPDSFNMSLVLTGIAIVTLGGNYTMWGIIISAPVLWIITQILPDSLKQFSLIINSLVIIAILLLRPTGLIDRKTIQFFRLKARSVIRVIQLKLNADSAAEDV
ncbi:MAG: branched-chain amino acid ABC transporter permease [Spirochaetes bacterium]|nr:branched-chain amino acid ABC transporter permease [Spirochaetota bacterium]